MRHHGPLRSVRVRTEPPLAHPLAVVRLKAFGDGALRLVALLHQGDARGLPPIIGVRRRRRRRVVPVPNVLERLPHEEVVPMYQRQSGMFVAYVHRIGIARADRLCLRYQPVDVLDERVDVLQYRGGRGGVVTTGIKDTQLVLSSFQ